MRHARRPLVVLTTMLAAAALLTACGASGSSTTAAGDGRPVIVATTSILGDITASVVGDLATVEVIIPANVDPHDFEPSARQVAELRNADLIVANGLGLEEGLTSVIESAVSDGITVVEVGPLVDPMTMGDEFDAEGDDHSADKNPADKDAATPGDDHEHDGDVDPHFWMDPVRVSQAAGLISDAVADATEVDTAVLADQTAAYQDELAALDAELAADFASIPADRRLMVTNHDAFGYLASRYGFDIVGTVIPSGSDMAEPSAASLAGLAALIAELGVPAIFTENIASPNLADTLAAETGTNVSVVPLFSDSIGEPGSGGETYIAMMRTNGQRIVAALG
jgi:zinc/manganese transport system substrate-binding protein